MKICFFTEFSLSYFTQYNFFPPRESFVAEKTMYALFFCNSYHWMDNLISTKTVSSGGGGKGKIWEVLTCKEINF